MAWSWCHSAEAYENLHDNIARQPIEWLRVVWAEWEAQRPNAKDSDCGGFSPFWYKRALAKAQKLSADTLADSIYERASEQAICDNGGFMAHCCPYGCGCHCLSFDPDDDDDDDDDDDELE